MCWQYMRNEHHIPAAKLIVFTDADNTLWDTDAVYACAQLKMLECVEKLTGTFYTSDDRLAFVRAFDQELATRHHKGLRYPPTLLAQALALGLTGVEPSTATRYVEHRREGDLPLTTDMSEQAATEFFLNLNKPPKLREDVKEGLQDLQEKNCRVFVITEGSKHRCLDILEHHQITSLVDKVLESPKHTDLYRRVCRLSGGVKRAVMIGDQLDRDILPAKEAGLITIYFPGGFRPKWLPAEAVVKPDFVVGSFREAARIAVNAASLSDCCRLRAQK